VGLRGPQVINVIQAFCTFRVSACEVGILTIQPPGLEPVASTDATSSRPVSPVTAPTIRPERHDD